MLHAPCCTAPALPCRGPRLVMNRVARGGEALWFGAVQNCRSASLLSARSLGCSCPRRTPRTVSSSTQGRRRRVYCAAVDTSSDRGQTQAAPFAGACLPGAPSLELVPCPRTPRVTTETRFPGPYEREVQVAIEAVRLACGLCQKVQAGCVACSSAHSRNTLSSSRYRIMVQEEQGLDTKQDRSLVTTADYGSQAVVSKCVLKGDHDAFTVTRSAPDASAHTRTESCPTHSATMCRWWPKRTARVCERAQP
jgi:hypothetical protein